MAIDGKSKDGVIEQSGTSAEREALDTENVIQGSEFYETDTTARYKFYSGEWVQIVSTGGASSYVSGGAGGGGGGGGPVTMADGADVAQGAKANAPATWYNSAVSIVSLIKLWIAVAVDAGSHVYVYTDGQLTSDAWTLFGTTRTKTFTYTAGVLTAESDWV